MACCKSTVPSEKKINRNYGRCFSHMKDKHPAIVTAHSKEKRYSRNIFVGRSSCCSPDNF